MRQVPGVRCSRSRKTRLAVICRTGDQKGFAQVPSFFPAATGVAGVGIVELEAPAAESLLVIQHDSAQIDRAFAIHQDVKTVKGHDDIALLFGVEFHLVDQTRATAAGNRQAQALVGAPLDGE